jgi:riboflavin synthase
MAKQQDRARNHAVNATRELIEGSDSTRSATAMLNRKDYNDFGGLQM